MNDPIINPTTPIRAYIAGAIRGDRKFIDNYRALIHHFESNPEFEALAELSLIGMEEKLTGDQAIYERDKGWLDQAECMVAEVSAPSLGVGYEIAYALHTRKIPVLALHHESVPRISAMIAGNTSPLIKIATYQAADDLIEQATRFARIQRVV